MTREEHQLLQLVSTVHSWLDIALSLDQGDEERLRACVKQAMMACDASAEEGNPRLRAALKSIRERA